MKFRYLKDPLFVVCVFLYFLNRLLIKHFMQAGFFHDHLNDLICIPFWVPIMIFTLRKLRLRRDEGPPRADEIIIPLIMWSAIFEIYLPRVSYFEWLATSDFTDIFWYAAGALMASVIWDSTYREPYQGKNYVRKPTVMRRIFNK
jgi:hypothetical protein